MRRSTLLIAVLVSVSVAAFAQTTPAATLSASDAAGNPGSLGDSVAISGSTVAAGSPGTTWNNNGSQGSVYVFTKGSAAFWTNMTEAARLYDPNGHANDSLGTAVGISGDGSVIVAVAPGPSSAGGAVFVFVRPVNGWQGVITPVAALLPGPPLRPWILQGGLFSVAINQTGDTIVAGAFEAGTKDHISGGKPVAGVPEQGAAYVWVKPSGGWANANGMSQTAKLTALDGVALDHFGWAVGISANTVVVGAPANAYNATDDGGAYLFQRPGTGTWHDSSRFNSKFTASDAMVRDLFGYTVAVGNGGALIAVGSGRGCENAPGAAYVFARPDTWWPPAMTQTAELTPSDSEGASCFGEGLAVGDELVIVGAPLALSRAGAGYTFAKPASGWTDMSLPASMVGESGSAGFGNSAGITGRSSAIGAPSGNDGGGVVYVFRD